MARQFNITPEFLAGAQVGRDNVHTITIADLETEVESKKRIAALKVGQKIYGELKRQLRISDHTPAEILDLINNAIIDIGLKVEHPEIRKQIFDRLMKIKNELKNPTP
jgi:hypothetical protein